ncbi:MAG: putative metal-dependent hydrolase [Parcubacteria bacterium C7867-008]|nr:MAG: putative metal-dependent hydrolase [Parcubacteria bacterium C7867-008]
MDGLRYEIRESARAKHVRIDVYPDGRVLLTKPIRMSLRVAETFLKHRTEWVRKTQEAFITRQQRLDKRRKMLGLLTPEILPRPRRGSVAYKEAVAASRILTANRLRHFNQHYTFQYGTISIRNQKTRWGSCSAAGNLSFNYRIIYLPPQLQDYLIVHELCHTKEHNHSKKFWNLVADTIPDYAKLRTQLKIGYQ